MHPILEDKGRIALYVAAWLPVGGLLAALLALSERRPWAEALAFALPMALVYAFLCLAAGPRAARAGVAPPRSTAMQRRASPENARDGGRAHTHACAHGSSRWIAG